MTRKVVLAPGEKYHIYNRGNSRQVIFKDKQDYDRFQKLLYLCNSSGNFNFRDAIVDTGISAYNFERQDSVVTISTWALMPNHFHLCLYFSPIPGIGENQISLFMRKLTYSYSRYFNKKYGRSGSLFEGRFKAVHIETESQSMWLKAYIHLNPLKLLDSDWQTSKSIDLYKAKDFLEKYPHSSYLDHTGIVRPENAIIILDTLSEEESSDHIADMMQIIQTKA